MYTYLVLEKRKLIIGWGKMVDSPVVVRDDLPANAADYVLMPAGRRFWRWADNVPASRSSHGCV